MPAEVALDPQKRTLYSDMLRAPPGHAFDTAVATSYTLDFETALVVPATLAFQSAESRNETLDSPLALLEGLERLASRIAIFCEAGRIQGAPRGASRLTALLEDTITEVIAPAGGAFHPKLWLIRFTAPEVLPHLRLALLSRNITRDMSWDLSLVLDGTVGAERQNGNAPLVELISSLPGLATGRHAPDHAVGLVASLAEDLARTCWTPPPGVDRVSFAVNGLGGAPWRPRLGRNFGIISPFLSDRALVELTRDLKPGNTRLLSRDDALAALQPETLARFGRIDILDDLAETGDLAAADQSTEMPEATGLHAKAFVTERYSQTEITIGSGNATSAALLDGRNVEVFATLAGPSARLGSLEDQFAPERLGRFLVPFTPHPPQETSAEIAAQERLEIALRSLASSGLTLTCEGDAAAVRIDLAAADLKLAHGIALTAWPLVLGPRHGVAADGLDTAPITLGTLALRDLTRWIGFRLVDAETGAEKLLTIGAKLTGQPAGRSAEILRSVIANRDAFLRYLRLLLCDLDDPMAAFLARGAVGARSQHAGGDDAPILEDMVKALSGQGRHLADIDHLVERLGTSTGEDGAPVIPADFLALWEVFRTVLSDEAAEPAHA